MKEWIETIKTRAHLRSVVALGLGALGLLLFVLALQMNFRQSQLYTQVTRMNEQGEQEMMIFRDFRDARAEDQLAAFDRCLLRNEVFGDGTGAECEAVFQVYRCIKASTSVDELEACQG